MMNNLLSNPMELIVGIGIAVFLIDKAFAWFKPNPMQEILQLLREMKEKDSEERHEIKETLIKQEGILNGVGMQLNLALGKK